MHSSPHSFETKKNCLKLKKTKFMGDARYKINFLRRLYMQLKIALKFIFAFLVIIFLHQKGLIISPTAGGVLADFWVPNEIDSLNFQHMLLF